MRPRVTAEDLLGRPAHDRVGVDRKHEVEIQEAVQDLADGLEDAALGLSPVLPPMGRQQHHPAVAAAEQLPKTRIGRPAVPPGDLQERVDDRVPGDENAGRRHPLRFEVFAGGRGRRKMEVGQHGRHPPVHLLGERLVLVRGPQPRLDVSHRDAAVEGRQGPPEARRGVSLHEHEIRSDLWKERRQPVERPNGDVRKRLLLRHDPEVVVRDDREQRQHLVQHLAVLGGHDDDGDELRGMGAERADHGRHLDRVGSRPEDDHDLAGAAAGHLGASWRPPAGGAGAVNNPVRRAPKASAARSPPSRATSADRWTPVASSAAAPRMPVTRYSTTAVCRWLNPR